MFTLTYEFSTKILHNNALATRAIYFALLFYQFESFASLNYSTYLFIYQKRKFLFTSLPTEPLTRSSFYMGKETWNITNELNRRKSSMLWFAERSRRAYQNIISDPVSGYSTNRKE